MPTESRHSAMYKGHFHFLFGSLPLNQLTWTNRWVSRKTPKGAILPSPAVTVRLILGLDACQCLYVLSTSTVHFSQVHSRDLDTTEFRYECTSERRKTFKSMELSVYYAMLLQPWTFNKKKRKTIQKITIKPMRSLSRDTEAHGKKKPLRRRSITCLPIEPAGVATPQRDMWANGHRMPPVWKILIPGWTVHLNHL